ncbi:MAG TPA: trigger factor [Gaiellaceae bacterium]|nr:trigger factor [Gaiellaceae bacterium]
MARVQATVERLPEDKVRISVEVPRHDLEHAVDHAASDLAGQVKIPGFRKGKVPMPVLIARVGKERLMDEAISSHIGGWFRSAASSARIHPVAQPDYEYDLPESAESPFTFTATVAVQPKVELPDWTALEVPRPESEVPAELVEAEIEALRHSVAELAPVEGRAARDGDVVVVDVVSPSGEARRDMVVELGVGRMVDELEEALIGMSPGETKEVEHELADETTARITITLNEIKEKVLPPVDDDLARAASEFDTIAELRADIEGRLREQIAAEIDAGFRAAVADGLVQASGVQPSGPLVDARSNELLAGFLRTLERRGISPETYLMAANQTPEQLRDQLRVEAALSVARELVLDAVAEQLGIEVSDGEIEATLREQGESDETVAEVMASPLRDSIREDLRLRHALDRVAAEVKPIPVELAAAREKLWTPGQEEKPAAETTLWTPGRKDPE